MKPSPTHRTIRPSVLYVGTPVYLVSTKNLDGSTNLAPASSHFALGNKIVLGLEEGGQSLANLRRHSQFAVNFLSADQWVQVERLAGVTGMDPVPPCKASQYTFEAEKFARAGLSAGLAEVVDVSLVAEAPIQVEAEVEQILSSSDRSFAMVEGQVVSVHAFAEITIPETDHLDPHEWHPLLYIYRHFFDRGAEVGWTRKNPLAQVPGVIAKWEARGGVWEVTEATADSATVILRSIPGGPAERTVDSADPAFVRWANVQAAR